MGNITPSSSVLLATGYRSQAERELIAAARATAPDTDYYTQAISRLGRLRLRQGRLEEAEVLLEPVSDRTGALLTLAALRHERGMQDAAGRMLERYLAGNPEAWERAEALDLLVSCRLSAGTADTARAPLAELEGLAAGGSDRVVAHRCFAAARVAMARNDPPEEVEPLLEEAMQLFSNGRMPYETARVRLALAECLAGQPEVAVAEAQGAFAMFDRLGATADAERGGPAGAIARRRRPHRTEGRRGAHQARAGGAAPAAAGLSNPEIADRLFLSRKTVSHHVSSILGKLGLRNRSEAAVQAGRLLATADPPH
jgi:hypothetical protein